VGTVNK